MRKSSFLTFCFAFVPGAGSMYLGMMNKGLALMCSFWGTFAVSWLLHMEFILWLTPVIFFYSFFETFNAKWLPHEQRLQLDREFGERLRAYWLGEGFVSQRGKLQALVEKRHNLFGWGLVLLGGYLLLQNCFLPIMERFFDFYFDGGGFLRMIVNRVPSVLVAVAIICLGVYLLRGKKSTANETPDYVEYKGDDHE